MAHFLARHRVLVLVEFEERRGISYGGMEGSLYFLKVHEILRFEGEPGIEKDGGWRQEFLTIKRNAEQSKDLLTLSREYPAGNEARREADDALAQRISAAPRMILAASSTGYLHTLGIVHERKWASVDLVADTQLVPADADLLTELRARLGDSERLPPHDPSDFKPSPEDIEKMLKAIEANKAKKPL